MKNINYCVKFNSDESETVAYNNPLFPVYIRFGKLSLYPEYTCTSHWHSDLEFILIKKGHMTYNVNGNLIDLTPDTGILVNSRQLHYGFSKDCQECEFLCILISPELFHSNPWFYENFIEKIISRFGEYLFLQNTGWQKDVLTTLEKLYRYYGILLDDPAKHSSDYFDLIKDLYELMHLLYKNLPSISQDTCESEEATGLHTLKAMITYIERHYAERITLQELAASGMCCKSKCSALFRKYLRDTPISYLTKFRLRKSLEELINTQEDITQIALSCGFSGTSYYCETFKKYYGVSPLRYRRRFAASLLIHSQTDALPK